MKVPEILKKLGYTPSGTEVMYNGMTGKKFDAEIFIGPTYEIRLKHMVQDKVHGRGALGPTQALTHQPSEGRSRDGGLKVGNILPKSVCKYKASLHMVGNIFKLRGQPVKFLILNHLRNYMMAYVNCIWYSNKLKIMVNSQLSF
jgi:hypothetical protein